MKTSIAVGGATGTNIRGTLEFVQQAERLGVDYVWSAEAWGQDAVTSLAYLAGQTSRIKLGTGIIQISARTPSMTAMSALALHDLSEGRFVLGLGTSGPQVVEGLQGIPFRAPLTRLKETVDIVRMAFRGEKLRYNGQFHTLRSGRGQSVVLIIRRLIFPFFWLARSKGSITGAAADGTTHSRLITPRHICTYPYRSRVSGRTLDDLALNASCTVAIGKMLSSSSRRKNRGGVSLGNGFSYGPIFTMRAFQRSGFEDDARLKPVDCW